MASQMDAFLEECSRSGDAAYAALKSLLERLENSDGRTEARVFLADVQRRFHSKEDADRCFQDYHFRIHDVVLNDFEGLLLFLCILSWFWFIIGFFDGSLRIWWMLGLILVMV